MDVTSLYRIRISHTDTHLFTFELTEEMPHPESSPPSAKARPIIVTGANGFIASHTIAALLRAGHRVIGTVRTQEKVNTVETTYLTLGLSGTAGVAKDDYLFTTAIIPDITSADAYTELFQRTQPWAIVHLASPFAYTVKDFEADLMEPAVLGTTAVLTAAAATSSVKRVVHTNSFACMYNAALGPRAGYTYTAQDWCPLAYADGVTAPNAAVAYRASKAVAEKTAWAFMQQNQSPQLAFDLVSLCPAMVFGPFLNTEHSLPRTISALNTSNKLVWEVLSAGKENAMPPTKGPVWIDVRDVADAHVQAVLRPEMGGRRFLLAKGVYCTQEIADVAREALAEKYSNRIPIGEQGVREKHNHFAVDASEEEQLLGKAGRWRDLKETLTELGPQLYQIEAAAC